MEGCLAPSEIPQITDRERSVFGNIAERLIYMDFCRQHSYSPFEVYVDDNNPSSYLYFLSRHNPRLNLTIFATLLTQAELNVKRPDMLVHSAAEKSYYEIKPHSVTGRRDGRAKLAILAETYVAFTLPYTPGFSYTPAEITVASLAEQLTVKLKSELVEPGLILYKLCLNSSVGLDVTTLAALLRYIVQKMNEQARSRTFRPIDLQPVLAREGALANLARALGIVMVSGTAAVGWKYFWQAVIRRFAVRAGVAATLAAADGPLPVGDLIAAGMAIWTVVDIIRLHNLLWSDAARIAREGA